MDDDEGEEREEWKELPVDCEELPPIEPEASDSAAPDDGVSCPSAAGDGEASTTGADPATAGSDEPAGSDDAARRSGMPSRSAASWSHSGGLSRNDVWFRSIRCGASGAGAGDTSSVPPYSSSYRRITSPTGSPGHSVASPLSLAITSR